MAVFKPRAGAIIGASGQNVGLGNDSSIDENNSTETGPIRRVNPNIGNKEDTSDIDKAFGSFASSWHWALAYYSP